jgi:hypothetical protein
MVLFSGNQPQTLSNPVRDSLCMEVIQCLIDWISKDPGDKKPHRILRALAQESLKQALNKASGVLLQMNSWLLLRIHPNLPTPKKRINWPGSFLKYWQTREPQIVEFDRQQGLL